MIDVKQYIEDIESTDLYNLADELKDFLYSMIHSFEMSLGKTFEYQWLSDTHLDIFSDTESYEECEDKLYDLKTLLDIAYFDFITANELDADTNDTLEL